MHVYGDPPRRRSFTAVFGERGSMVRGEFKCCSATASESLDGARGSRVATKVEHSLNARAQIAKTKARFQSSHSSRVSQGVVVVALFSSTENERQRERLEYDYLSSSMLKRLVLGNDVGWLQDGIAIA